MPVPKHLLSPGLPAGKLTCRLDRRRFPGLGVMLSPPCNEIPVAPHGLHRRPFPLSGEGNLPRFCQQGRIANRRAAMPKIQRIWYTRYALVHIFSRTASSPASPSRAPRLSARGLRPTHNVQLFSGFAADTLKPEACTMCREFNLSDLFCNCLPNKELQNNSSKRAPVSRTSRFMVRFRTDGAASRRVVSD